MSRFLTIKGKTQDEKFKHLEVILKRMSRRLHKTISVVIPPTPMFSYVQAPAEDGSIVKCLFPASGKVTKICLAISEFTDKNHVRFDAELVRMDIFGAIQHKVQKSFSTRKNIEVIETDFDVMTGDMMTLSTPDREKLKGIWTCLLYVIEMPEGKIKEISFDELDGLIEEGLNEGVLNDVQES